MEVKKDEELKATSKASDAMVNNDGPKRRRRIREKKKQVDLEGREFQSPTVWYMKAVKEGAAGIWVTSRLRKETQ